MAERMSLKTGLVKIVKVYLASRFGNRLMLASAKSMLENRGHKVTSRWIHVGTRPKGPELERFWKQWAKYDVEDMNECKVLILCTMGCDGEDPPRGGMRFEEGYCYAQDKPIIVVGPKIIVFDQLPDIHYCNDWDECFKILDKLQKEADELANEED